MKRRSVLQIGAAAGLAPWVARAQVPPTMDQLKPYLQVKTIPGEETTVRVFFSVGCAHSRSYLQFFKNLSRTLPTDKAFRFTPLVNKADGIAYAMSFLCVEQNHPRYVENFVEASLIGVQDRGLSTLKWSGLDRIAQAAQIPTSVPKLVQQQWEPLRQRLGSLLLLQKALAVTNTPAVAVAGTYIVTPEFTGGDAAMFSQLVNGLISMAR